MIPRVDEHLAEEQRKDEAYGEESGLDLDKALWADVQHVRSLVSQGDVERARALTVELQERWPESKMVAYWARVLAPPTTRRVLKPDPRSRPLDRDTAWLREHAREYPGRWLAVFEDRLIAADPDLKKVLELARRDPDGERALLHFEPGTAEPQ